jgi:hypothetical protein
MSFFGCKAKNFVCRLFFSTRGIFLQTFFWNSNGFEFECSDLSQKNVRGKNLKSLCFITGVYYVLSPSLSVECFLCSPSIIYSYMNLGEMFLSEHGINPFAQSPNVFSLDWKCQAFENLSIQLKRKWATSQFNFWLSCELLLFY